MSWLEVVWSQARSGGRLSSWSGNSSAVRSTIRAIARTRATSRFRLTSASRSSRIGSERGRLCAAAMMLLSASGRVSGADQGGGSFGFASSGRAAIS
jgi:hypothetical protein